LFQALVGSVDVQFVFHNFFDWIHSPHPFVLIRTLDSLVARRAFAVF